jgi:diacylglycerol kinase (ATP)
MKWSITQIGASFYFAFMGILQMLKTQRNAWIHCVAALMAVILGFFFDLSRTEWMFIIFAVGFVFAAELFNTAVEVLTDIVSPERAEKAGLVKDLAAGAVLVAAITALVTGMIIFLPKIF